MNWGVWFRLGRVSNLPTVWTNVLAALALSQVSVTAQQGLSLMAALSLFYVGGMFLNDAFDRELDAVERPGRPIPAGLVSPPTVFLAGGALLLMGAASCVQLAQSSFHSSPLLASASAAGLAGCIVFYNAFHKGNPLSPLVMGLCRVMVYVTVAFTVSSRWVPAVGVGCLALLAHLIGLTYVAKQESLNRLKSLWPLALLAATPIYGWSLAQRQLNGIPYSALFVVLLMLWVVHSVRFLLVRMTILPGPPSVPGAVVRLIAGIALVDAVLIASTGRLAWAAAAVAGCGLTRVLQRYVPGT